MSDNRKYIQAQKFKLAGSGISATDTSITLQSFMTPNAETIAMTDVGTLGVGTLGPGTSREEIITFTGVTQNADGTATLTGVTRGCDFRSPYTQDTALRKSHSGNETFILSNNPQFYDSFVNKENDETINGLHTFTQLPKSNGGDATDGDQLITYAQALALATGTAAINRIVVAGNAGETVSAGQLLYLLVTDGEWYKCDADTAATVDNIILGIAQGAGTNGNAITNGVLLFGLDSNQTGLTTNTAYYASNTAGAISSTVGTVEVSVGISRSTTSILFYPRYNQQLTEDQQDALVGTVGTPSGTNKFVTNDDTTGTGSIPRLSALPYTGFGDGSDGVVVISAGTTTLTRDMYYQTLTIQTGGILVNNGFRIFVRGTLTFEGTGKITANGNTGGTGGAGTQGSNVGSAGTAGTVSQTAGSLPLPLAGFAGGAGGAGASGSAGSNGTNGTSNAKSIGSNGSTGGAGSTGGTGPSGSGPGAGGTPGTGGTNTGTVFNKLNSILSGYYLIDNQPTITTLTGSSGSGGGSGGGGGRSPNASDCGAGGGGGGSGSTGGFIWVSANTIVTANGNVYAQADGGTGGNGGAGGNSLGNNGGGGSGGGGGAGGSGGVIIIYYYSKTGTGTASVAGGSGGTGGALGTKHGTGTDGTAGANGTAGLTGQTYIIQV